MFEVNLGYRVKLSQTPNPPNQKHLLATVLGRRLATVTYTVNSPPPQFLLVALVCSDFEAVLELIEILLPL